MAIVTLNGETIWCEKTLTQRVVVIWGRRYDFDALILSESDRARLESIFKSL